MRGGASAKPRRIEVDEQVNASASFRRGMLSMLSNDLVLTIGMPLVAGLELRQLGGVLAHEFGHFSQGAGMRLTYIIRTISHWFTRVVYERDAWDEQLVEWSQRSDFRIQWILYLARLFVWLTRRILWVLMMVGHGVSGYMLRQMEFDADRHEARLAGSDVFASTSRQIALLSVASQAARSDLDDFYREGRLCDDLPKLILHNSSRFSPEVLHKIDQMAERTKTGWLDTHPCQQERIASAAAEQAAGIFRLEMPASVLFADYDAQCRQVTLDYYREIFGEQLSVDKVFPVDQLLARQEYEHEAFRALHRFLQGTFRIDRPLRLPSWQFEAPADMQAVVQQVKLAREQIVQGASQYEQNYADYEKSLPPQTAALNEQLSSYEACVGQRIESALQLLSAAEIASQIARAAEWKQEITALLPALRQLNNQVEHISKLVQGNQQLGSLFQQLSQNRNAAQEAVVDSLRTQMLRSVSLMSDIRNSLTGLDYPFEHAQGRISLGDFALAQLPESDNAGGIYEAAGGLIESASRLRALDRAPVCDCRTGRAGAGARADARAPHAVRGGVERRTLPVCHPPRPRGAHLPESARVHLVHPVCPTLGSIFQAENPAAATWLRSPDRGRTQADPNLWRDWPREMLHSVAVFPCRAFRRDERDCRDRRRWGAAIIE